MGKPEQRDASEWAGMVKKPHKYGVAAKENRTYDGVVYDSKAEAIYAAEVDLLFTNNDIKEWERQVTFQLGPDSKTRVDFVVTEWHEQYAVEIKGVETPAFRRVRRLWKKYGTMDMIIKKRHGNRWQTSRIRGGAMED